MIDCCKQLRRCDSFRVAFFYWLLDLVSNKQFILKDNIEVNGHPSHFPVVFSRDGNYLKSAGTMETPKERHATVDIWDVTVFPPQLVTCIDSGTRGLAVNFAFSKNSLKLVASIGAGVKAFALPSGKNLNLFESDRVGRGQQGHGIFTS